MKNAHRIEKLKEMGLKFDGSQFTINDINVHWIEIVCLSDKEFDDLVNKIQIEMKRRKNENL